MNDVPRPAWTANQLNQLVLDYLVVNGYSEVAERFALEAGIQDIDVGEIRKRQKVCQLVREGDIQQAIEELNSSDPWFLDTFNKNHFKLLQLQLIELIRNANIEKDITSVEPALEFAEKRVLPMIQQQTPAIEQELLQSFQRVMALVCLPAEDLPADLRDMMAIEQREALANNINKSLLEYKGMDNSSRLWSIMKLCTWAEEAMLDLDMPFIPFGSR